jgi:hypothetical protein
MTIGVIRDWYEQNIVMLANFYENVSYDDNQFTWVLIDSIDLPEVYYGRCTPLLIITPGANIQNYEDYNFYINQDLRRIDGNLPPFVHETDSYNNLYSHGFARLSFHLERFDPRPVAFEGDNLLTLVKSVYHFLGKE